MESAAPGLDPDPAHAPACSLRERKKRVTHDALRRAAVQLVAARGLAAVTVDDIAAAADVSSRTFFNYFRTKEDAVCGLDVEALTDMVAGLRRRPATEPPAVAVRAVLLDGMATPAVDHRDLMRRLQVVRSDPHLMGHYASSWAATERRLSAALAERRGNDPASDRYASLVVATSLAAARIGVMAWCDTRGRVPLREEMAFHLDVLAAGLAEPTTPGRQNPTTTTKQSRSTR